VIDFPRKALAIVYVVSAVVGCIILLLAIWAGNWDFGYWLSSPIVSLALSLSETVVRFLSGFGLVLTYLAVFEGILIHLSTAFKGKKTTAKSVFGLLVFIPILLPVYSAVRLSYSWFYGSPTTLFDMIYLLAGMWGLIISIYLLPISRGEFSVTARRSDFETSESKTKKLGRNVKKLYHEKIRKQYAEAYRIEVVRMRERLNAWRGYIGTALLLPFALGSLVLPPVAFLFIVLCIKASVQGRGARYDLLDRSILAVVTIAAGVFATIQVYMSLGSLQLVLDGGYLIGTIMGYTTFLYLATTTLR
jgi:hypothetical protein